MLRTPSECVCRNRASERNGPLCEQEDLGSAFSREAPGESWLGEDHTQQHALDVGLRNWVDGGAHP